MSKRPDWDQACRWAERLTAWHSQEHPEDWAGDSVGVEQTRYSFGGVLAYAIQAAARIDQLDATYEYGFAPLRLDLIAGMLNPNTIRSLALSTNGSLGPLGGMNPLDWLDDGTLPPTYVIRLCENDMQLSSTVACAADIVATLKRAAGDHFTTVLDDCPRRTWPPYIPKDNTTADVSCTRIQLPNDE